jgi:hypothetical protein
MDLFRVMGRWAASCRLAWIRVILRSMADVSGQDLTKAAPNLFPKPAYFSQWGDFIESVWRQHINNIVQVVTPGEAAPHQPQGARRQYRYTIDRRAEQIFIEHVVDILMAAPENLPAGNEGKF